MDELKEHLFRNHGFRLQCSGCLLYTSTGFFSVIRLMYGIDFEEFLWGMGISEDMIMNICGYLGSKAAIPEAIHSQMMKYFRQYVDRKSTRLNSSH